MMEKNIYILFAVIYFFLGLLTILKTSFKDIGLKGFIILTVLLPITKFTTNFHIIFQVSIYYYFFIGVSIIYILKLLTSKISKSIYQTSIVIFFLLAFYLIHFFLFVDGNSVQIINVLKDIKPFVLLIVAFLFTDYYKERLHDILSRKFCVNVLWLNAIACVTFFYLMVTKEIHLTLTPDPYYKYEELRLETLGCYFGLFYLLYLVLNNIRPSIKEVLLCVLPLLLTGNRTLIFTSFFIIILYFLSTTSLKRIVLFFSFISVMITGIFVLIFKSTEDSPLFRFKKLIEPEYIEYALLNRFSPFVESVKSFHFLDFIFGKGLGFTFFIPWFVWRENINNDNIYIDNLYLTLYAKYGVFSIVFFIVIFFFLKKFLNSKMALFYFLFILLISITNAFIYQYNFLWILILFTFPFRNEIKTM